MSKLRVAVVVGGPSTEREVSLRSGAMVMKNLEPAKYEPFTVDLSDLLGNPDALVDMARRADFVFLALHGAGGEDRAIQGASEVLGLPYYGPGVMASAIAMDEVRAKSIYRDIGAVQGPVGWTPQQPDGRWLRGNSPHHASAALVAVSVEAVAEAAFALLGPELVLKGASRARPGAGDRRSRPTSPPGWLRWPSTTPKC